MIEAKYGALRDEVTRLVNLGRAAHEVVSWFTPELLELISQENPKDDIDWANGSLLIYFNSSKIHAGLEITIDELSWHAAENQGPQAIYGGPVPRTRENFNRFVSDIHKALGWWGQ